MCSHLLRHALVCMTAYYLLVVIGLFAGGEVLSALGDGFVFGCGCWFLWLVCVFLLWLFLCCCVSVLACAPYAPSYISYDDSSHSEWHLTFFWDAVPLVLLVLFPRSQGLPVS